MDRLIAKTDWESYFNSITKLMRGHLLEMEIVGLDVGDQIEESWVVCDGLSYDQNLEILYVHTLPLSHLISHPKEIYALEEGAIVRSICVKDGGSNFQLLNFREPLRLAAAPSRADEYNEFQINNKGAVMATNANIEKSQSKNENRAPALLSSFTPTRMFDELFRGLFSSFEGNDQFLVVPRVDVEDREDEYCVTVDIPGVPREDVILEVNGNQLTIAAERDVKEEGKRRSKRMYAAFQRTLMLPPGVDTENISAEVKDGVLSIHMPKTERSKSRRIQVGDESRPSSAKEASASSSAH